MVSTQIYINSGIQRFSHLGIPIKYDQHFNGLVFFVPMDRLFDAFIGDGKLFYTSISSSFIRHKNREILVFLYRLEIYSYIDSSRVVGNSPEVSNLNRLFLKLNRFVCN